MDSVKMSKIYRIEFSSYLLLSGYKWCNITTMIGIKKTTQNDCDGIFTLYKKVASITGGLARVQSEITESYISGFLNKSFKQGLSLLAVDEKKQIVGEIHAYISGLSCFSHVFTELTVAVDPDYQGQGVGRQLFEQFLFEITENYPEILRIELIARESNRKAIQFYQSLGFEKEGCFKNRIKNPDGSFESDITMAWLR